MEMLKKNSGRRRSASSQGRHVAGCAARYLCRRLRRRGRALDRPAGENSRSGHSVRDRRRFLLELYALIGILLSVLVYFDMLK